MSKAIVHCPGGLLKNSVIGAVLALVCYVLLQCLVALLIHCEILGEEMLYPMICLTAALSSFVGCIFSVVKGEEGGVLSASAVTLVFLALTVVVGLLSGEAGTIGAGLTGVGGAMAIGGLLAAMMPSVLGRGIRRQKGRGKRSKRH